MMFVNFKYILFFIVLLLSSCAVIPPRQPLNNHDKINIHSTRVLLNTNQDEIVMRYSNWFDAELIDPEAPMPRGHIVHYVGGSLSGGLIGAMVVNGIQSRLASIKIAPIRSSIDDFDFLKVFNSEIQNNVAKLPWLKVKKQIIRSDLQAYKESEIVNAANENTTLFIGTTYALNSTFKRLEVAAYAKLAQKSTSNQKPLTLYTNNMYFIYRLSDPNQSAKANKEYWMKHGGEKLREKLHNAASLLANIIANDIGNPFSNIYQRNKLITFRDFSGFKTQGHLIKQQDGYYIISSKDNEIYVINEPVLITR